MLKQILIYFWNAIFIPKILVMQLLCQRFFVCKKYANAHWHKTCIAQTMPFQIGTEIALHKLYQNKMERNMQGAKSMPNNLGTVYAGCKEYAKPN